ncbi:hypothetical protein A3G14_03845 [Candidatus Curtissbacteria bacterium RIFCSPLOWO2_12_FULL_38_9]|uniref:SprT-like domain-containing protein n=1 Tax=Candidatus Curtissbacteria bacterium RIFCSPLOWO2_12_FULL_38_9 TaxID=1797735 RepID=A0A1F5IC96_9BACT|nr:MAG: hypothetical protein A3G14_03845 [Candidatus Curtissbacteria bacterium RIFCSPLOWO2_12_FULL_38_9]
MRDDRWLEDKLEFLLRKYFANVKIKEPIEIKWGRNAKYRFGSIKLLKPRGLKFITKRSKPQKSIVTITSMFKDEKIPVAVVEYTIAHELCHYSHGFSSSNKRLFRHPHHGGVINQELTQRGAEELIAPFKTWLKSYRAKIRERRIKF